MNRIHVIYIDDALDDHVARFVCAHELGHAMLHRGENRIFMDANTLFVTSRFETEADHWAADLLLSDDDLREEMLCRSTVQQIACTYGLPEELVLYRIHSIT